MNVNEMMSLIEEKMQGICIISIVNNEYVISIHAAATLTGVLTFEKLGDNLELALIEALERLWRDY